MSNVSDTSSPDGSAVIPIEDQTMRFWNEWADEHWDMLALALWRSGCVKRET